MTHFMTATLYSCIVYVNSFLTAIAVQHGLILLKYVAELLCYAYGCKKSKYSVAIVLQKQTQNAEPDLIWYSCDFTTCM